MIELDRMDQASPQVDCPDAIHRGPREATVVRTCNLLPELGPPTELRNSALAWLDRRDILLSLVELRLLDFLAVGQPRPGLLGHLGDEHRLEADIPLAFLGKNAEFGRLVRIDIAAAQE